DGEDDVDRRMAKAVLAAGADALADDRDARLVVTAEDGRAVGADDVTLDDGTDALAGHDGVHVRAEEERRHRGVAGDVRDQVPHLAVYGARSVVEADV